MSITGAFLILFVTFHALMNGVALFWPSAYNEVCLFLGANWYALIGTVVLAAGVIFHFIFAAWLTLQNRRARGHERYAVTSRPKQVEWSSKNMFVLGVVVIAFLVIHLIQFWSKMQLAEILHCDVVDCATGESVPPAAGTWFLAIAFRQPLTLPIYLIGFIALWFHMTHGFWSMFHTVGWSGKIWMNRLKCIGNAWITIVIFLFAAEAIVFTVQANRGAYTSCPVLIEQYQEMAAEGKCQNAAAVCAKAVCDKTDCVKTECVKGECAQGNCQNAECAEANCSKGECLNANCTEGNCQNADCQNAECHKAVAGESVNEVSNE